MKCDSDIQTLHARLSSLTARQRKRLVASLRGQGIPLRDIRPFVYPEAPGIKHIFLYFEGKDEAVPYFEVEKEMWCRISLAIMEMA